MQSVALLILHPHPDLVSFPVRSAPEWWPVLRGGHPMAEGAEGSYNGWLQILFGPPSHQDEPRVEQPTATVLRNMHEKHKGRWEKDSYCFDAGSSLKCVS